jgi:hypothetical protein
VNITRFSVSIAAQKGEAISKKEEKIRGKIGKQRPFNA